MFAGERIAAFSARRGHANYLDACLGEIFQMETSGKARSCNANSYRIGHGQIPYYLVRKSESRRPVIASDCAWISSLTGKLDLITGSTAGIGFAIRNFSSGSWSPRFGG